MWLAHGLPLSSGQSLNASKQHTDLLSWAPNFKSRRCHLYSPYFLWSSTLRCLAVPDKPYAFVPLPCPSSLPSPYPKPGHCSFTLKIQEALDMPSLPNLFFASPYDQLLSALTPHLLAETDTCRAGHIVYLNVLHLKRTFPYFKSCACWW